MSINNNNNSCADDNNRNSDENDNNNNSRLGIVRKQFQEKEQQRLQSKIEKREILNKEQIDESSSNIASETLLLINNLSSEIENQLNQISSSDNSNNTTTDGLKDKYELMEHKLSEINSITTMSSHILTLFDVKLILENLEKLKKQIDKSKDKYMPKQKLSLTRKKTTKPTATTTTPIASTTPVIDTHITPLIKEPIISQSNISGFTNVELYYPPHSSSTTTQTTTTDSNNGINDLLISDLIDCKVYLDMKVLTALKINNLVNCQIIAFSPIDGSIFIDNCKNSTFYLVSRQIRIHYCVSCQFNIFVKSNPIIEGSNQIKFSSFLNNIKTQQHKPEHQFDNQRFKQYSFDLESDNIDTDKWKLVNDFDWIQPKQSPNWSILE